MPRLVAALSLVLALVFFMLAAHGALAGNDSGRGTGTGTGTGNDTGQDNAQPAASTKIFDPALPAGRDPGGIAVSWVGHGLDYTADHIRNRLVRDGEGELTGFDFADNDRRPFAPGPSSELDTAGIFLAESQTGTLVVLRTARDDPKSLFTAIGYGLRTPARLTVILNDISAPETAAALIDAATHFPAHLFVTGPVAHKAGTTVPANLIRVAAAGAAPQEIAARADIAVPVELPVEPGSPATAAAEARVAALAVRLMAVEPGLDGVAIKARILAVASASASAKAAAQGSANLPVLNEPRRHFWLE